MYWLWEEGGVQISSTSISGSISATEANERRPCLAANWSLLSGRAEVTATTCAPLWGKFSKWKRAANPVPAMPIGMESTIDSNYNIVTSMWRHWIVYDFGVILSV